MQCFIARAEVAGWMSEAGCKAEIGSVAVSDGSASMMMRRQNHADFRSPTKCMDRLQGAIEILQGVGSRSYVSGLFDRLAGRGLDGSTHASSVSLADRLFQPVWSSDFECGCESVPCSVSIANLGEIPRLRWP